MATQLEPNRICQLHKEQFMFYCMNCEQFICVSCVEEHNDLGHALRKLDKAFPLIAEKCRASEEKLNQRKQTLDKQLQARKDARKEADTNGERAVKELLDVFAHVDALVAKAKREALTGAALDTKYRSQPIKAAARRIQLELATFPQLLAQQDPLTAFALWQRAEQLLEHTAGALRTHKTQQPPRDHVGPFLESLVDGLLHMQRRDEQGDRKAIAPSIPPTGIAVRRPYSFLIPSLLICLVEYLA